MRTAMCVFLLACGALPPGAALAASGFQEIDAPGVRLIYPAPLLSYIAPYTARCFENAYRFHTRYWGYAPWDRVNLIMDDAGDYGNAGVTASPRNTMVVHIAPSNFVYETGPSNERINFTMNHEMTHVVALDQASGSDRLFRRLFLGKVRETDEHPESILYGYLTVPRRAAPRWYHEGIAVFCETWMAGGIGRAQGPYDEMVFRAMVRDSAQFWDPLGLESEGTRVDFQVGVNSYLYGTRFMDYLAYRYGPDTLRAWISRQPGSRKYFSAQFRHEFGRSLEDVWHDWAAFEREFQHANLDSIRRYPVTPARDLSREALGSVSRAYVDSARRMVYVAVQGRGSLAHVAAIPLDGGPSRTLAEVKGPALYFVCALAWDPDRRMLYYTADNNDWRDLMSLDPATGRTRRLIRQARIGDLAFDRADRSLWGVRHFNGYSTVVRLAPPYRDWHQVWTLPYGRDLYDLDISPDGRWLSASMAEISGRQSLQLYDLARLAAGDTSARELHDFGTSIPTGFVFTGDGRALYGTSYYTGVSNVWRYDLALDSLDIVSNAETGLFRPVPLGGDSLLAFRYTGQGFVPAVIAARPLTDVSAVSFLGAELVERRPELKTWKVPSPARVALDSSAAPRPYRPLASVRPVNVYPVFERYKASDGGGLRASFSDPLGFHQLDVSATWTGAETLPSDQRWHLAAEYRHAGWTAKLRRDPVSFYDLFGPVKTSRRGNNASLAWTRTLIHDTPRTLELAASASGWTGLERLPDAQNVATLAGFDKLVASEASLTWKNLRSSIGAADYEKGQLARLTLSANTVRRVPLAGDARWRTFPIAEAALDLGHPLPLRNSSLWLRTAAGGSNGDPLEPFANTFFGGFGNNVVDHAEPKRFRDVTSLPGFEIDQVAGRTYGRAQLELNLPPLRFERAGVVPFYATWARLALFTTALVTDPDRPSARERYGDIGAQVDVRFQLLTQQPLTLSFGFARATQRHGPGRDQGMISLKIL